MSNRISRVGVTSLMLVGALGCGGGGNDSAGRGGGGAAGDGGTNSGGSGGDGAGGGSGGGTGGATTSSGGDTGGVTAGTGGAGGTTTACNAIWTGDLQLGTALDDEITSVRAAATGGFYVTG